MTRVLQSVAIVVFFLAMAFTLVRDHVLPSWDREGIIVENDVLTDSWVNQDEWFVLKFGNTDLGSLRTVAEKDDVEDFYVVSAHLAVVGGLGRVVSAAQLDRNLQLQEFRVRIHFPGTDGARVTGEELWANPMPPGTYEIAGIANGREIRFALRRDDAVQFKSLRLAKPVTLSDSLTPILRGQMLTKGVAYSVDAFDPLLGSSAGTINIEYLDDVVPVDDPREGTRTAVKKVELRKDNTRLFLYVDDNGTVIRREIPILAGDSKSSAPGTSLLMDRVDPIMGRDRFPELVFVPEEVTVSAEELTGSDKGQVLKGFSAFSFVSKMIESNLTGGGRTN